MTEQDKIIASLRKQLLDANSTIKALEQENALLNYEFEKYEEFSTTSPSTC